MVDRDEGFREGVQAAAKVCRDYSNWLKERHCPADQNIVADNLAKAIRALTPPPDGAEALLRECINALEDENPFEENDELIACPACKQMSIMEACDEPDCWESTTCGTPTETGYRRTCSKHRPT